MSIKAPWLQYYGDIPESLDYPDVSMFELIEMKAGQWPDLRAYEFLGKERTYREFLNDVHQCAKGLASIGIRADDRVTICMPNTPQGITMFYALNLIGAIPNMVHPLSAEGEIEFFLTLSKSRAILVLDAFYPKVKAVRDACPELKHVITASIATELSPFKAFMFRMTKGRKIPKTDKNDNIIQYTDLMKRGAQFTGEYRVARKGNDPAAILYSGGTTGKMKGIVLTNMNFNALGMQTGAAGNCSRPGLTMLAIMPMFHGFGLGVCIHTILIHGGECILVPQFSVETYAKLLKKAQPNYIAGVPTLYEALLRSRKMKSVKLACLRGVFSGGDSLSVELKKKVDRFLKEHGAQVHVREGYGTTECVTASCLTPQDLFREGSIGIPFPDTFYKIVDHETCRELPYGEEGEICISGPSVMKEYLDEPEETADTLRRHEDGRIWLHTGDLGVMDKDGFIYFKQRLKRMIVSSGYSIYPSQIENIIDSHPDVLMSTVIGVPDPYKVQKVKAYIVLKPGIRPTDEIKEEIRRHCEKNVAKYAMPYDFEYRDSLPKTLVGKVAYTVLEEEAKREAAGK